MKSSKLGLLSVLLGLSFVSVASANPYQIQQLATNVAQTAQNLYQQSATYGDYGYPLNALSNLAVAAKQFAYSLSPYDYQNLKYAYNNSRSTWTQMYSYNYLYQQFAWLENQFNQLSYEVEHYQPQPYPPYPNYPYVVTVQGHGAGGSTHGDKAAACQRANDRSIQDAYNSCSQQNGQVVNYSTSGCSCSGPSSNLKCVVNTTASCQVH